MCARCWSISVEQWITFLRACVDTETWEKLVEVKGEYGITMYDIKDHFVVPWTRGTGCSVALLMNAAEQHPVEGMLSHAWSGSVVETYNCLQNMVNRLGVPKTARCFFCTFSMYQPEDGAKGALSIAEQIELEPFAKIIESGPKHGMFVVHTTVSEVYERLWVVHEADVATDAQLQIQGLFDMYRWAPAKFEAATAVQTREGKCGEEKDRVYIDELIQQRGGYDRLDAVINNFRKLMLQNLRELLENKQEESDSNSARWDTKYDWETLHYVEQSPDDPYMERHNIIIKWLPAQHWNSNHLPLGADSYPHGRPGRTEYDE